MRYLCSKAEGCSREPADYPGFRRGADPKVLMDDQRAWIHDARDVCNEVECMLKAYEERISDLDNR